MQSQGALPSVLVSQNFWQRLLKEAQVPDKDKMPTLKEGIYRITKRMCTVARNGIAAKYEL